LIPNFLILYLIFNACLLFACSMQSVEAGRFSFLVFNGNVAHAGFIMVISENQKYKTQHATC